MKAVLIADVAVEVITVDEATTADVIVVETIETVVVEIDVSFELSR